VEDAVLSVEALMLLVEDVDISVPLVCEVSLVISDAVTSSG